MKAPKASTKAQPKAWSPKDIFGPPDPAKKPAVKKAKAQPEKVGSVTIEDFYAALGDRYPHHDIRSSEGKVAEVSVPGGMIYIDRAKAMSCNSTAELRAYIDSLEVQ